MSVTEQPRSFNHRCDRCSALVVLPHGGRPGGWSILRLERGAEDYGGVEVADASIKYDLCPRCTHRVSDAISKAMREFDDGR